MHSAVPVAIGDMNGDGLDDIVTLNSGERLYIQYQTPDPERPFVRYGPVINIDIDPQNDIIIADFNRDGANDVFTIGSYDRGKLIYGIPYTYSFDLRYKVLTPFFSQGATAGDFNGDGWIDVVVLNDNGLNYTLLNDGTGDLDSTGLFDFETVIPSDNSGNYGSVYTDFDMDGDSDFYIAKCRQNVNNPNDPRRINALFVNDGNNNYTEAAAAYGLADGSQTWTADFGDIDNDGDMDCFMTQHDVISEIFENINNDTFINITPQSGLNIGGIPLQGMFSDIDNDGFQDILVSGDRLDFYRNNGDKTFTKQNPFGAVIFGTFALGDLNNDGFTDVYASRVIPFNNPNALREDILFLNEKNDNHFLGLRLNHAPDMRQAIGAVATLYGEWGIQIKEVRSGEQYGVSNGHTLIFGLGSAILYDSLVIRWPDGTKESYYDLGIDTTWAIEQGGCYYTSKPVWPLVDAICGADSIILHLDDPFVVKQWSTGSIADSIIIKESGLYFVTYTDDDGCYVKSVPVEVIINPDTLKPLILYEGSLHLCAGDSVNLTVSAGQGYQWMNGDTSQTIKAISTGDYYVAVSGFCEDLVSDTIHLDFFVPDIPVTHSDSFLLGENATLLAEGDSIVWYSDEFGNNVIGTGEVLILEELTKDSTVYARNLSPIGGLDYEAGPEEHAGLTMYNASFVNGGLIFEVNEPIRLKEFTVFTDFPGARIFEITNGSDFFFAFESEIEMGANVVQINAELPVGEYVISTNSERNIELYGDLSPMLWRTFDIVEFPYEVEGVLSITNSTYGMQYYYYFYDWKISTADRYCASDLVEATAIFDFESATNDPDLFNELKVFPNPTDNMVALRLDNRKIATVEVLNMEGDIIMERKDFENMENEYMLELTDYPAGMYIVRLLCDDMIFFRRIIKL